MKPSRSHHRGVAGTGAKPQQSPRTNTLAGSVLILLAVTIVQRSIGFGRGLLFCRWLDPATLGQWELALSFLLLAAPLAVLGLPGSFGRYVEHYRRRGQLRMFLRRTAVGTALLSAGAITALLVVAPQVSQFVFGRADCTPLVVLLAIGLAPIIGYHFLTSLFAALRMFRVVSGMQMVQSVGFAVLGVVLLQTLGFHAACLVAAYAGACVIAAVGALLWQLRPVLAGAPAAATPLPHASFWTKLVRFSLWVWVTNLLANLFGVADRYMIVHYSGFDPQQAIAQVGQYHSSCIVPVLLISMADMLATVITPFFSRDWEAGNRDRVGRRLNLALKVVGLGMLAVALVVLVMARPLFDLVLGGKFADGQAVLPWTLSYCSLFGITIVAQNYLWCAEKARLCSLPLLVGLVGNIGLNLVLLPRFGLVGAVLATTAANVVALVLVLLLSRAAGMIVQRSTWLLCLAPTVVGFGPWVTGAVLAIAVGLVVGTDLVLGRADKHELHRVAARYVGRIWQPAPPTSPVPIAE